MGDKKYAFPQGLLLKKGGCAVTGGVVEAGKRLVEKEQLVIGEQRPREGDPPLHSAAEQVDRLMQCVL